MSLHGGHSGAYCDHAEDTLEDLVRRAITLGMPVYGLSEHAPRFDPEHLYAEELSLGWDNAHLTRLFANYAAEARRLQAAYADQITLLAGFEAEVVPDGHYATLMRKVRDQYHLDYMVGSVHWVGGIIIDYTRARFDEAVDACGGREELALRYYDTVAGMLAALQPEIVGHLDLIRRYGGEDPAFETPRVRERARQLLALIREQDAILDINTAGYRKGLASPYPAPWIIEAARDIGVACCFGDDAHRTSEVGAGITQAREYLLAHGITAITVLARTKSSLDRQVIPL